MFRAVWIAALVSNLGSWVHLVAASWLMASLTTAAAVVAALLAAAALMAATIGLVPLFRPGAARPHRGAAQRGRPAAPAVPAGPPLPTPTTAGPYLTTLTEPYGEGKIRGNHPA